MANPFTDHPRTVGETYLQHSRVAGSVGVRMIGAGFACLVHAALPFLFVTTGSHTILALAAKISAGKRKVQAERVLAELTAAGADAD
ncbi:MAG: hypothetical protein EXQ95_10860 [Alphaproteobacteria bacterium]|nr:hypothetical protein [Alphaproteobacteria bacterium]